MDKEIEHQSGAEFLKFVAWAHANRKQLIWAGGLVLAAGFVVGMYFLHQQNREDQANEAFGALNLPFVGREMPPTAAVAAQFAQVANNYPGTGGGANALLVAGGIYYDVGQYDSAKGMFERFLAERGDSPLASKAAIGEAACMEAMGDKAGATARYETALQHGQDSTWPEAKSALARLYTEQNHPDRALQQYKEILQAGGNDSWTMEARVQAGELLEKYPDLARQLAAQAAPSAPAAAASPGSTPVPVPVKP